MKVCVVAAIRLCVFCLCVFCLLFTYSAYESKFTGDLLECTSLYNTEFLYSTMNPLFVPLVFTLSTDFELERSCPIYIYMSAS